VGASRRRLGLPPPVYGAGAAAMAAVQAVTVASWGADMARHGRGRTAPRECGCVRRKKRKRLAGGGRAGVWCASWCATATPDASLSIALRLFFSFSSCELPTRAKNKADADMDTIKSFFQKSSNDKADKAHKGQRATRGRGHECGTRRPDPLEQGGIAAARHPHATSEPTSPLPVRLIITTYVTTHETQQPATPDKLAPAKAAERERKEAHKSELAAAKAAKAEAAKQKKNMFREERAATHDAGHRAAADARAAARREKHAAGARVCGHGVSRCRICFPPDSGRGKK